MAQKDQMAQENQNDDGLPNTTLTSTEFVQIVEKIFSRLTYNSDWTTLRKFSLSQWNLLRDMIDQFDEELHQNTPGEMKNDKHIPNFWTDVCYK